jgi:hypothetical protein
MVEDPPPAERVSDPPLRPIAGAWRSLIGPFLALTLLSTLTLYVGATETDRFFAWTVQPPMSAAFLGGGYAAGFLLIVLTARQRVWAHARIAFLTVLVFVWLTAVATFMHLDRFHFTDAPGLAQFSAWLWLAIYVVVPVWMAAAAIVQRRVPGTDPPITHPLPPAVRLVLIGQGVAMVGAGVALMVAPAWAAEWWPWEVAPLAARASGAWLIALGFAALLAAIVDHDFIRLRAAAFTYAAFAVLQAGALARFAGEVRWELAATWVWLALLVSFAALGGYGGYSSMRTPKPSRASLSTT